MAQRSAGLRSLQELAEAQAPSAPIFRGTGNPGCVSAEGLCAQAQWGIPEMEEMCPNLWGLESSTEDRRTRIGATVGSWDHGEDIDGR